MNILKKLGITPGPWIARKGAGWYISADAMPDCAMLVTGKSNEEEKRNTEFIASAPEMLEALLDWCLYWEKHFEPSKIFEHSIFIIEKATGKTWDEIKKLMEVRNV